MSVVSLATYLARLEPGAMAARLPLSHLAGSSDEPPQADTATSALAAARAEGFAAGQMELETMRASLQCQHEAALACARAEWVADESAALVRAFEHAVTQLSATLGDRIADVLKPVVLEAVREKMVTGLATALERLFSSDRALCVELAGPPEMTTAICARLPTRINRMICTDEAGIDVRATVDATVLETQLGQWITAMDHATSEVGDG